MNAKQFLPNWQYPNWGMGGGSASEARAQDRWEAEFRQKVTSQLPQLASYLSEVAKREAAAHPEAKASPPHSPQSPAAEART
jgi:hypothetical protein